VTLGKSGKSANIWDCNLQLPTQALRWWCQEVVIGHRFNHSFVTSKRGRILIRCSWWFLLLLLPVRYWLIRYELLLLSSSADLSWVGSLSHSQEESISFST
jgi:hypothetical protein